MQRPLLRIRNCGVPVRLVYQYTFYRNQNCPLLYIWYTCVRYGQYQHYRVSLLILPVSDRKHNSDSNIATPLELARFPPPSRARRRHNRHRRQTRHQHQAWLSEPDSEPHPDTIQPPTLAPALPRDRFPVLASPRIDTPTSAAARRRSTQRHGQPEQAHADHASGPEQLRPPIPDSARPLALPPPSLFPLSLHTSGMARGVVTDGFVSARFAARE